MVQADIFPVVEDGKVVGLAVCVGMVVLLGGTGESPGNQDVV